MPRRHIHTISVYATSHKTIVLSGLLDLIKSYKGQLKNILVYSIGLEHDITNYACIIIDIVDGKWDRLAQCVRTHRDEIAEGCSIYLHDKEAF